MPVIRRRHPPNEYRLARDSTDRGPRPERERDGDRLDRTGGIIESSQQLIGDRVGDPLDRPYHQRQCGLMHIR